MKTKILILLAALAALSLSACRSRTSPADGQVPVSLIQKALDEVLPRTHAGPAEFVWGGDYLKLEVRAGGLRHTSAGWAYDWLSYRRTLTVPWFTGLNYKNGAWVMLGTPPTAPVLGAP